MVLIRQIARKTYRAAYKANTRVESNEGYKYPHRVNYPRHHHPFFAANIRYDFPPRFNFSHASTPSIHPPPSHRCFFHPVSTVPTLLVSRCPPCTSTHSPVASLSTHRRARHPSRSREDHRDASLRSWSDVCHNVVVVAVTIATFALIVVRSSAARINRQESADDRLPRVRRGASVA